jgi:hypothetical protein
MGHFHFTWNYVTLLVLNIIEIGLLISVLVAQRNLIKLAISLKASVERDTAPKRNFEEFMNELPSSKLNEIFEREKQVGADEDLTAK